MRRTPVRILGIGKKWSQFNRVRNIMTSMDSPLARVYTLRKDHKAYLSAVEVPQVKPVCGVDSSSNENLSWLISTFFYKLCEDDCGGSICLSTEEMIAEVDRVNRSSLSTPLLLGPLMLRRCILAWISTSPLRRYVKPLKIAPFPWKVWVVPNFEYDDPRICE